MLCRGWSVFFMFIILYSILPCTIRPRGSRAVPSTEPTFFISLLIFFKSLMLLPQQMAAQSCWRNATDIKGPKLPLKVMFRLEDSMSVAFPIEIVWLNSGPPNTYNHLLCFWFDTSIPSGAHTFNFQASLKH